jgi:hypothetical protein
MLAPNHALRPAAASASLDLGLPLVCFAAALLLAVPARAQPVRAADGIRPGHEAFLEATLQQHRLVCDGDAPDCRFSLRIERDVMHLDDGPGPISLHHGEARPAEHCLSAPAGLWVCPPAAADPTLVARAEVLQARLTAVPAAARALASVWGEADASRAGPVSATSRTLDVLAGFWTLLTLLALTLATRALPRADRARAALLFLGALTVRITLSGRLSNWYLPLPPEGGLAGVFRGSYPVVFDTAVRAAHSLPGAGDDWLFMFHRLLGAVVPAALFLGSRRLGMARHPATLWAALTAAAPALLWLSSGDAASIWPLAALATAFLGFALAVSEGSPMAPTRAVGGALAVAALLLGAATRVELLPGLFAVGLLVPATGITSRRALLGVVLLSALAAAAATLLLYAPLWRPVLAQARAEVGGQGFVVPFLRLMTLQSPALPAWAWLPFIALPGLLGLALTTTAARRARLLPLLGLAAAAAPAAAAGFDAREIVELRYVALALPYGLWFVAAGALPGRLLANLPNRWRWLAVIPVAGMLLAGQNAIRAESEWQAEFRFLRRALAEIPADCIITAIRHDGMRPGTEAHDLVLDTDRSADGQERGGGAKGLPILQMALPHPLLALRFPTLTWDVRGPDDIARSARPPRQAHEACHAVYLDPVCHLALGDPPQGDPDLIALVALYRPACRRLAALAAESPYETQEERFEVGAASFHEITFQDRGLALHLARVR